MDCWFAFGTTYMHRERGLLMPEGKTIKNKEEFLFLLKVQWESKQLAIIHSPGHQKLKYSISEGNKKADETAQKVALKIGPFMP